jgi:hypothetical protein
MNDIASFAASAAAPCWPRRRRWVVLLVAATLAGACAGQAPPEPPIRVPATPPESAPPAPSEETREEPLRPTTVVIDDAGKKEEEPSLLAASRKALERRKQAPPPRLVIDDDNLAEIGEGGSVTLASPAAGGEGEEEAESDTATLTAAERDEAYWRAEVRRLRQQWHDTAEEIGTLERRAEGLRTRFYAEDDPYVRDRQIKPAWDRALDRLAQARLDAEAYRAELAQRLEEGRRAGALPGWLREGIELEPVVEEPSTEELDELQPIEPPVLGEDGRP